MSLQMRHILEHLPLAPPPLCLDLLLYLDLHLVLLQVYHLEHLVLYKDHQVYHLEHLVLYKDHQVYHLDLLVLYKDLQVCHLDHLDLYKVLFLLDHLPLVLLQVYHLDHLDLYKVLLLLDHLPLVFLLLVYLPLDLLDLQLDLPSSLVPFLQHHLL
jgi:hypothetical protein